VRWLPLAALGRSQPVLPMMPGMPEQHPRLRPARRRQPVRRLPHIADGTVISELHRRHRHQELLKFLKKIDKNVQAGLDVHLVCDNYGTQKTPGHPGLARPPSPLPRPLHPDGLKLDQPGRALVRLPHRPEDPPWRPQVSPGSRSRHPRLDRAVEREPAPLRLDKDSRGDPQFSGRISVEDFRRMTLVS